MHITAYAVPLSGASGYTSKSYCISVLGLNSAKLEISLYPQDYRMEVTENLNLSLGRAFGEFQC